MLKYKVEGETVLLRKETHLIWGIFLAYLRDTSPSPAPKALFLVTSVSLRTWVLKTAPKDFGHKPLSAVTQWLCTHWATYQDLLISRLSNRQAWEYTFLCFQTNNKSFAHLAP